MPIVRPHAARFYDRRISSVAFTSAHLYGNVCMWVGVIASPVRSPIRPICPSWGAKFTKCEIPCFGRRWTAGKNLTPLALSLAEKIRNRTNTQKRVNDISTHCLSARVDNKLLQSYTVMQLTHQSDKATRMLAVNMSISKSMVAWPCVVSTRQLDHFNLVMDCRLRLFRHIACSVSSPCSCCCD